MKKTLLALAILGTATLANANMYVQGNISRSVLDDSANIIEKDKTPAFRVAVGSDTGAMRYAVDATHYGEIKDEVKHEYGKNTDKITVQGIGASAIFDLNTGNSPFTPYAGARVGVNRLEAKSTEATSAGSTTDKSNKTAVGAGMVAGLQYAVSDNLAIDAGVEYNKLGSIDIEDSYGNKVGKYKPVQKGINLGVRFDF